MKLIHFLVPGSYEDAYLYMGHLLAITREQTLRVAPLAAIFDSAIGHHGQVRQLARVLFERNDELAVNQDWVTAALKSSLVGHLSRVNRTADSRALFREFDLRAGDSNFLDMIVYNQRMFLSSTSGLFHLDMQFDPWPAEPIGGLRRRLDGRCLTVTARFGSVAASAEERGLFMALDEFSWMAPNGPFRALTKVAGQSRRASWAGFGLYNYASNRHAEPILGNVVSVRPQGVEQERMLLANVIGPAENGAIQDRLEASGLPPDQVQYMWSTLSGVFAHGEDGTVRFVSIKAEESRSIRPGRPFALPEVPGRVISASSSAGFSVLETDFAVWALVDGQRELIVEAEATSVRCYPLSRWFKHVASVALADGILLVAILGAPYSASERAR